MRFEEQIKVSEYIEIKLIDKKKSLNMLKNQNT